MGSSSDDDERLRNELTLLRIVRLHRVMMIRPVDETVFDSSSSVTMLLDESILLMRCSTLSTSGFRRDDVEDCSRRHVGGNGKLDRIHRSPVPTLSPTNCITCTTSRDVDVVVGVVEQGDAQSILIVLVLILSSIVVPLSSLTTEDEIEQEAVGFIIILSVTVISYTSNNLTHPPP